MTKTINVKFDGKYAFQLTISGSHDLVKTLTSDVFFNGVVRNAIEALIKDKVAREIKEANLQTVRSITKENK